MTKKQLTNGQPDGTWFSDPAHFRRPSRRDFLYVGMIGGLGLTLGDYFNMQNAAKAATAASAEPAKAAAAKAVIHIFLPGGMAAQESWDPKPFAPLEYRGPMGTVKTKIEGEVFSECMMHEADGGCRRQDLRRPLDDARGSGPRARHAQYVHRVSPEPGDSVPELWIGGLA